MINRTVERGVHILQKKEVFHVFAIVLLGSYVALRMINLSQAVQKVKSTADTTAYLRISRDPLLSRDFLAGSRPCIFTQLQKIFRGNEETVAWAQGIFSSLSWSALALSMAASLKTTLLKYAALGLFVLLSLYQYIIGWDSVLLTESLSLSLMALFLASWLWLARGWSWYKAAAILAVSVLWAFCRDTNAWVLLMIAGILLLLVALGALEKKFLIFPVAFGIIFVFSNLSADLGGRWIFPFQNVLGRRILTNPEAVDFFAACGMPVTPELMRLTGEFADGLDRAFYVDPALVDYRSWLHRSGKSCYMKWLLSNPARSFREPLNEFNGLLGIQNLQSFLFSRKFSPVLPGRIQALLYPSRVPLIVFVLALMITIIAGLTKAWQKNPAWLIPIVLILLVLPHYFLVWHGDVLGIDRHVITVSIQLYLGTWLLLLMLLDRVLARIRSMDITDTRYL
jgi:hypothetical protein